MKLLFTYVKDSEALAYLDSKGPFACAWGADKLTGWMVVVDVPVNHPHSRDVVAKPDIVGSVFSAKISKPGKMIWGRGLVQSVQVDEHGNCKLHFVGPVLT